MYFYMVVCFKTLDKNTSVDQENISAKRIQFYEQTIGKFDLKICVNPGLS